jgi:hypothetical protein
MAGSGLGVEDGHVLLDVGAVAGADGGEEVLERGGLLLRGGGRRHSGGPVRERASSSLCLSLSLTSSPSSS